MAWPCYMSPCSATRAWWRHQTEKFSMLLAICAGNSPVRGESPYKGQWRGALMFCLICVWINGWVNNGAVGDLRRYRAHGDVIVMVQRDNTHIHKYFSVRPYDECLKMHKTLCFGVVRKTLSSYFSLLSLSVGNQLVAGGFPWQKDSNADLWCFVVVSLNKLLNKHSIERQSETPWWSFDVAEMVTMTNMSK